MDLEGIRAFMAASQEIQFEGRNRKEVCEWVRQTAVEEGRQAQGGEEREARAEGQGHQGQEGCRW